MANSNFIVQNGLTVGPLTIDAAAGNLTTSGVITSTGSSSSIFNGNIFANSGTISTSTTTGALVVNGGVGASGNVYIGGNLQVTGTTTFFKTEIVTATEYVQQLIANGGTASTSTSTGALQVQGGAGITGNLYVAAIYSDSHYFANGATITTPAGGSNTYVQFNDGSTFSGTAGLTFNKGSNAFTVSGLITANTLTATSGYQGAATGPLNGTIGATTPNTGAFTTISATGTSTLGAITASTVSAGTIGNASATLTGTINTATQNSITTMTGLTGFGTSGVTTTSSGNFTINGNVAFNGSQVTHYDSIIDLHTYGNLLAWTVDDGFDIGLRLHYYSTADKLAFMGMENSSKTFQFLIDATEVSGNVTGTFGNVQAGSLYLSNSTVSTSKTSGALILAGGLGTSGNVFANAIYSDNHYFANGATITTPAGGSNTYVQFNDGSTFSGTAGLTFNKGSNAFTVSGPITASALTVTGTSTLGNITASTLSAGTIGNASATLTGTINTATQNSITTMTGLTGFGTSGVTTTAAGNFTVSGNLTVNGTQTTVNTVNEVTEYVSTVYASTINAGNIGNTGSIITGTHNGPLNGPLNGTIGATTANTGVFTSLTATSGYQGATSGAHNGTIGATTANTGAFTTLTSTGQTGLANTAVTGLYTTNGVFWANGTSFSSGSTATTQALSDNSTNIATTNWVNKALYSVRAAANMTGGGTISYAVVAGYVKWTSRFIVISDSKGTSAPANVPYFDIVMPTSGSIDVVGTTAVTATANGIPLSVWQALYYDLSAGSAVGSTAYHIMDYNVSTANYMIPATWVLVCVINGDSTVAKFSAGVTLAAGQSYIMGTNSSVRANYADLAENYASDCELEPGEVVVFGGNSEITKSLISHDDRIAGIVSTNPAYLMNSNLENGIPVALQGRVPCKVLGPVAKGQNVVASSIPGVAQALDKAQYMPGCVIGKSLEQIDNDEVKVIEIVVGRL